MSDNKGYFKREPLPKFLTEKRFSELGEGLQDFIVQSARMQSFLQSRINVNDIDSILSQAKYQMELGYQSIVYIDSIASEERKDYSVVMEALNTGVLNLDIAMMMRETYCHACMDLRKEDSAKTLLIQRTSD